MGNSYVFCLDLGHGLPSYIHFTDDYEVHADVQGCYENDSNRLARFKIGRWVEHYPNEYTHLQYAKVYIDPSWQEFWDGVMQASIIP